MLQVTTNSTVLQFLVETYLQLYYLWHAIYYSQGWIAYWLNHEDFTGGEGFEPRPHEPRS